MILDDLEQRIVAEAGAPRVAERIRPRQAASLSPRIVPAGSASATWQTKLGRPPLGRHVAQLVPAAADCSTRRWPPDRSSGRKARPAPPSSAVDRQAAVVGQHPMAQVPGLLDGLQRGVGGKRVAVFDHLDRVGKIGQRPQFQPGRREQIGQFQPFFAIGGAENQERWRWSRWSVIRRFGKSGRGSGAGESRGSPTRRLECRPYRIVSLSSTRLCLPISRRLVYCLRLPPLRESARGDRPLGHLDRKRLNVEGMMPCDQRSSSVITRRPGWPGMGASTASAPKVFMIVWIVGLISVLPSARGVPSDGNCPPSRCWHSDRGIRRPRSPFLAGHSVMRWALSAASANRLSMSSRPLRMAWISPGR